MQAPVFVVSAPFSGDGLVCDALSRASGVWHSRTSGAGFLDTLAAVDPAVRGWAGHGLAGADAVEHGDAARAAFPATLVDREGRAASDDPLSSDGNGAVAVATGSRLALRVPFLAAAFPEARFVAVFRTPQPAMAEMVTAWNSGRFISCPELPGWTGTAWSLPLIPEWKELIDAPLEQIVARQWQSISDHLLDDLEALAPERWAVCDLDGLLADPRGALLRLCAFLGVRYDQALLTPVEAAARTAASAPTSAAAPSFGGAADATESTAQRWRDLVAPAPPAGANAGAPDQSPFRSVFTRSFPQVLKEAGGALLISTYQSGRLICARAQGEDLNTHFRTFDKPMGIAVWPGRFALATRAEVWDFRDMPGVAPKVQPAGHDACYLPRNRHLTGDALMHDLAYAGGELWGVATRFSCLVTLDGDHSFVPRWTPPFIDGIQDGDRCHLNGLAVRDDRVAYVTALGQTGEPRGWREGKASGGCLIDVASSEVICAGLSMPHSPRWHDGRLWVLQSGRGEIGVVDLGSGSVETVAELPGFTRGLAIVGDTAFVGLSQIRESSTFGDLPLTARLSERVCGVWMVDIPTGTISGFLRFDDLVQEIFDVVLLPGVRYPEIAEPGSTAATESFVLP